MFVDGLVIPGRLLALLDAGIWPRTADEANRQNLQSLVSAERIHLFAPDESKIYLYQPPFRTVAEDAFMAKYGALQGIETNLSIAIGDFGIGADAPILLDYRASSASPSVIRLRWLGECGVIDNHWVRCADHFDQFADMLGLD